MDMNDYIELTYGNTTLLFHKDYLEQCVKSIGKLRGFASRHARPEEQKEVANCIDTLQGLVTHIKGLKK